MALFFNFSTVERAAAGDIQKFLLIMRAHHSPRVRLSSSKRKSIPPLNYAGYSFLLNPADILSDSQTDPAYIYHYIKLASHRNYADFSVFGRRTLDLSLFPHVSTNHIRHNPLLNVVNNQVHFKYEELI